MAPHTSGADASVTGKSHSDPQGPASKERYTLGVLGLLEQEENNLTKLPKRTDRITITIDMSVQVATIDLLLNVTASLEAEGRISYTATHYLTGSTFTSGTGGESSVSNLAQAAQEAVIALKLIEMDPTRNLVNPQLTVVKRCQHIPGPSGGTNATFSASLEFPIVVINLPGGGTVIEAKNYLN